MPSLLIISPDKSSISRIKKIAYELKFQIRSIDSIASAKELLKIKSPYTFDALLVDSRYESAGEIDLITTAWEKNEFIVCGIFNFYGSIENEWNARLIGAHAFSGNNILDSIYQMLDSIPKEVIQYPDAKILLVEDLDSPRFIISSYIKSLGYEEVETADSAKKALKILDKDSQKFFCVITDVNMPEMTGIELVQEIRKRASLAHLPVTILTSYSTAENLIECIKAGASGFLVKPPKKDSLRKEIEKARRITITKQSPRLCKEEDAHQIQDILTDITPL